ncbi:ATP-binding protein [Rhodococcus sp. ACT016]|uniref:ATP-binding protein n=1 Tax=Rhodococcus sp. ACT016 TaxID=3134808 RepID=UPI003D2D66AB
MEVVEPDGALETYEVHGFRVLVDDDYAPPPELTLARFRRMAAAKQRQWLDARLDHMGHMGHPVLVQTDDMTRIFNHMWSLLVMNRHAIDRRVCIVSGQSGVGKTTIVRSAGVLHERAIKRKQPNYRECGRIPVVMIDVPAKCTCRAIDKSLLDFLHVPYRERAGHDELKRQVVHALIERRTELIIIDDASSRHPTSRRHRRLGFTQGVSRPGSRDIRLHRHEPRFGRILQKRRWDTDPQPRCPH